MQQPALVPVRGLAAGDETVSHELAEPVVQRAPLVEGVRIHEYVVGQFRMAHHPGALGAQPYFDQIPVRGQRIQKRQRSAV
ncbi:hypothetical protein GCM10010339_55030 [Streptomyces alanosinicus]|uniref:Uncharacterized protein n=1 Tax=Streptomyces alanosinicus TaxID=68171 RepID=A0A919D660_9ACTN|nr:hypothetical protein GCM10010339_55030 [Streptomyces alanosinicus]